MVGSLPNLRRFYQDLIAQVRPPAAIEEQEFQAFVKQKTGTETIQPWDRNYYERLFVEESLQLDHQKIKEYFTLDRSLGVLFALIHRLYGLTFIERTDLPKLHSDVVTYEVRRNGQTRSFVYFDPYSRSALKTSGAWMSTLATLSPSVISVNMNLQKPSPGEATLMSPDNVVTLFHEFGHGLHGILSQVRYHSQFGTRVLRDAVELPSQFMENYVFVPSVLGELAHHYKTGEALPPEELAKIIRDREFRVATQDLRQIRYGILDLAWHSGEVPKLGESLEDFESRVLYDVIVNEDAKAVLISPSFSHIFDGGYAAGYYSYKWADHFEKKAFAKFEREGLFNPDTAQRFEKYFLSVGDSMDPQEAFDLFIDESEAR
jgi:peptidyl-dipeptidase Dcp